MGNEVEGGCYNRNGSTLDGKNKYQLVEIDGNYGDYCNKDILFTGGQWGIYFGCDANLPILVSSAPDNGALDPPLTGWTFGITLIPNCVPTTTTTEPPPFVPDEDNIVLSNAPTGNGCYTRVGLVNGKYKYERAIGMYVYVVQYSGSRWQHYRIPNSGPSTGSDFIGANDTDFNSLSPPSNGWEDVGNNNGGINNTTITYQDC